MADGQDCLRTGALRGSRVAAMLMDGEYGPALSIVGMAGWLAKTLDGIPVSLLSGGPLDAPDRIAAGSMRGTQYPEHSRRGFPRTWEREWLAREAAVAHAAYSRAWPQAMSGVGRWTP